MFFRIAPDQDMRFPVQFPLREDLWLNCDTGWTEIWTEHGFAYIKGYCFEHGLNQYFATKLMLDPEPCYTGNFVAVLAKNDGAVVVTNDTSRATPLWRNDEKFELGNMGVAGQNVWADAWVVMTSMILEHRWSAVPSIDPQSFYHVVDEIHNRLTAKFNWLALNTDKIKVFFSGGIDTLTCISYLRALDIPFELVCSEHFDYDQFTCEFDNELKAHWGYTQIHHYREPTMLVTGACGDEYFLRGPATANIMLMHLGKSMEQVLKPTHYHYQYFQGIEKSALYKRQVQDEQIQKAIQSKETTADYILRMCINDHQHWHLGRTYTFTPFKDISILKLVLSMDDEQHIIESIVDAKIQKLLIARNEPELLGYLVKHKNMDRTAIYKLYEFLSR